MLYAFDVLKNIAVMGYANKIPGLEVLQTGFFPDFTQCTGDRVLPRLLFALGKIPAVPSVYHKALPGGVLHQAAGSDDLMVRGTEQFEFAIISKRDTFFADVYFVH
jgi:hypothetical protein